MPDVFELQASVKIDTSEANQKLNELIAKAKQLDGDLGKDHTVKPPTGDSGGKDDSPKTSPDNNGGGNDKPPATQPSNKDDDGGNGPTVIGTKNKLWETIKKIGTGIGWGAGALGISTMPVWMSALLYDENADITKTNRLQNTNYALEEYNALNEWIQLSNKIATEGWDMDEGTLKGIEERRGAIMSQYNTGKSELWNKYFGYTAANNLDSMAGDILPQLEELGLKVSVGVEVEEGAAEDISAQIGGVVVPATVQVTGVNGGGIGPINPKVGEFAADLLGDAAGAVAEGLLGSFLGKRKKSVGMERIPTDNYVVALHQDESVLTREEAAQWRKRTGNQGESSFDIANALRGVNVYLGADQVGHLISGPVGANIESRQNYKLRSMGG